MDGGLRKRSVLPATKLHEVFFLCLQASPSYLLAHKLATGDGSRPSKRVCQRFEQVERTYRLCGSVWAIDFEDWWTARGADAFAPGQPGKGLSLARSRITAEDARPHLVALEHWAWMRKLEASGRPWLLTTKRKRRPSELAKQKALAPNKRAKQAPGIRLFQLAMRLGHADPWLFDLSFRERREFLSKPEARAELAKRFGSSLNQGARLVENAARGRFPSYADLTGAWALVQAMRPQLHLVLRAEMRRLYAEVRRGHDELRPDQPFALFEPPGWDVVAVADLCGDTFEDVKRVAPTMTEYEYERQLRNRERLRRLQAEIPQDAQERLRRAEQQPPKT